MDGEGKKGRVSRRPSAGEGFVPRPALGNCPHGRTSPLEEELTSRRPRRIRTVVGARVSRSSSARGSSALSRVDRVDFAAQSRSAQLRVSLGGAGARVAPFHVAFMLHGVAAAIRNSLEMNRNGLQQNAT